MSSYILKQVKRIKPAVDRFPKHALRAKQAKRKSKEENHKLRLAAWKEKQNKERQAA